jgi:uncharacterized protein (DUF1501 family)
MRIGTLGTLGLTLPNLLAARASSDKKPPAVILLFLDGGASQEETWDPNPDAPKEYRCLFGLTKTRLPGMQFCDFFPRMANHADKLAIVRTFTHQDNDHGGATHWVKTGYSWPPEFLGKAAVIPQQSPSAASVVSRYFGPINTATGVPRNVRVQSNHGGYPGDDAVWLGQENNPFKVRVTRGGSNPMMDNMGLKVPAEQLADRRALLQAFDQLNRGIDSSGIMAATDKYRQQAVDVLLGQAREAFDLSQEPDSLKEKYGKGLGEELLLARRLCERGAGFVTLNNGYWDHHGGIVPGCKQLCPPLDQAVGAYLEDVQDRGLFDDILLIVTGEFGRTPRVNGGPGRDHWAGTNCIVFAGGGLKMGQVIGETDEKAAYPKTRPVTPSEYVSTIFQALGMPKELQYVNQQGRPMYMVEEYKPIDELF